MIKDINEINTGTEEGQLLMAAMAKITTESQTDKTPGEVLTQLQDLKGEMYGNFDNPKLGAAIDTLKKALKEDTTEGSYYYSWQANIAQSMISALGSHIGHEEAAKLSNVANEGARNFLDLLIRD